MTRFFFPQGRAGAALALLMLFELGLCIDYHHRRWVDVIAPLDQPATNQGEGLIIRGNGLGYYAWLRSMLIDHDWDFANEFDEYGVTGDYVPPPTYKTGLGRRANQWSIGPACVWAVFVVPGHFALLAIGDWSPWAADGYSLPYQLLVGAASLTMSFVGQVLLYRIALHFARPSRAALTAILLTLGSTIIYYDAMEISMAHGDATAVLAGLIYYWLTTYGSLRRGRWFAVGLLMGAVALTRWQLITFAILPIGEIFLVALRTREYLGKRLAGLVLTGLGATLAFFPQMIAWRCVYGHWFVEPIPQIVQHWLSPSMWELLLSEDRSLFYWTPICALAFFGYVLTALPCRRDTIAAGDVRDHASRFYSSETAALLFAAFGLQIYALASLWGKGEYLPEVGNFAGAFLSRAYGMRHLTESVIALAPGLAILLERASRTPFRLLCALGFVMVLWNMLLVFRYAEGLLPVCAGLAPGLLLQELVHDVVNEPWFITTLIEGFALFCFVLFWGNQETSLASNARGNGSNHVHSSTATALRLGIFLLLLAALFASMLRPIADVGFFYRIHRDPDGTEVQYAVFVPHDYHGDRAYPALLYLHGFGQRRWNNDLPPREPLASAISEQESKFDMIAVFPTSVSGAWEAGSVDLDRAMRILDEVKKLYRIDSDRLSLTGISRGAFGVWTLAASHPDKWAAIVPICGGGNPIDAPKMRRISCWCFHGSKDNIIPVDESRRMIEALQKAGGAPQYYEYKDVGHNCWDKAFRNSGLFDWLKAQVRRS